MDTIPVIVFAYNRPDLLEQLLFSLKNDNVPLLYIFCDGAKNDTDKIKVDEVREIINRIDWCEKSVFQQSKNLGLGKSILFGVTNVLNVYNSAIIFEDDLICVKGTYSYLSSFLMHYENTKEVLSVTGWTHPKITPNGLNSMPYFDGKSECWCWGTWSRAWKGMEKSTIEIYNECFINGIDVEKYGSDMPKMALEAEEKNLWAIRWWYLHLLKGGLCLRPPYSLVETTGWDGRGTTITPDMSEWANPPLKDCPPIPDVYPDPIENKECSILWKSAIDNTNHIYQKKWNQSLEKITSGIWIIEELLTNTECEYIKMLAIKNGFQKANNSEKYGRYNQETFFTNKNVLSLIRLRVRDVLFKQKSVKFILDHTTENLELYLYKQGDFIKPHSDAPVEVSKDIFSNYTLVIYLDTNFSGGETFFHLNELKIKPNKGGAILFDQNLSHGSSKILTGEKYILRLCLSIINFD